MRYHLSKHMKSSVGMLRCLGVTELHMRSSGRVPDAQRPYDLCSGYSGRKHSALLAGEQLFIMPLGFDAGRSEQSSYSACKGLHLHASCAPRPSGFMSSSLLAMGCQLARTTSQQTVGSAAVITG